MLPSTVQLCLACSCSLPPRKSEDSFFHTPCCNRPICSACISMNPRLARYNPCLHCLGGVGVVGARSKALAFQSGNGQTDSPANIPKNVDGGVHDEDVFTIGDDNEEDDEDDEDNQSPSARVEPQAESSAEQSDNVQEDRLSSSENNISSHCGPPKYYIRRGDTLLGISMRFGIDGRLLCRLNNLPPSTLRTTPHLLHTRTFLVFPPSTQVPPPSAQDAALDEQRRMRREREVAEKRFQTLTKEVDCSIAKAYVALADPSAETEEVAEYELCKEAAQKEVKEVKSSLGVASQSSLEARAIDRYLDDDEWETRERNQGRAVSIPKFPLFEPTAVSSNTSKLSLSSWWKTKS